jgi:hypothetical protein
MKKGLLLFTLAAFACTGVTAWAVPPTYNGGIIVESKTAEPGESFILRIWLAKNDIGIAALRVPLKFDSRYLTCTYIDFGGTVKAASMEGYSSISGGELEISYIPPIVNPSAVITADSGLLATAYFTVSADAPEITLSLDSINHDTEFGAFNTVFHSWRRVEVAEESGAMAFLPYFISGDIEIRRPADAGDEPSELLPGDFSMVQNYPNPFNPATVISFSLSRRAAVLLEIFNIIGQKVATAAQGEFPAGKHEVAWDAGQLPSGVYFYRLSSGSAVITRKMLLLK